jgi:hypothetical protein
VTAQLTLLQVNLLAPPEDKLKDLTGKVVEGSEKLEWFKNISDYWFAPSLNHLHIIVESPVGDKRNIKPSYLALDIKTIDEKINDELKKIRGKLETFLKNPEPPTWIPPNSATASNQEFLKARQIPRYSNGDPSLLFHNLDVCDNREIEMIFGPGPHQYVVINCVLNISQHVRQVHLQHIWLGQNPSHVGRPHEILGILLRCNARCQRSWRQRFTICLGRYRYAFGMGVRP